MQLLAGVPLGQDHQTEEAKRTWSRYHTPAREQYPFPLDYPLFLGKGILLLLIFSLPYPSQHEVTDVSDNGTFLPELLHGFTPGICGKKEEAECLGWRHTARQFMTRRKGIFDSSSMEKSGNLYFGSGGLVSSYLSVSLSRSSGGYILRGIKVGFKLKQSGRWQREAGGTKVPYCESL